MEKEQIVTNSNVEDGEVVDTSNVEGDGDSANSTNTSASEASEDIEFNVEDAKEVALGTTLLVFQQAFGEAFQKVGKAIFEGMFLRFFKKTDIIKMYIDKELTQAHTDLQNELVSVKAEMKKLSGNVY